MRRLLLVPLLLLFVPLLMGSFTPHSDPGGGGISSGTVADPPPIPAEFDRVGAANGVVDLFWSSAPEAEYDFSHYLIFRGLSINTLAVVDTVFEAQQGFTDTGLDNYTTYYYALKSVDAGGNASAFSSYAAMTPVLVFGIFEIAALDTAAGNIVADMTVRFTIGTNVHARELFRAEGDSYPDSTGTVWGGAANDTLSGVWGTGIAYPVADPDSGGVNLSWVAGIGQDNYLLQMNANGEGWVTVANDIHPDSTTYTHDIGATAAPRRGEINYRLFGIQTDPADTSEVAMLSTLFYNQAKRIYTRWYATQDSVHVTASRERSKLYKAVE